MPGGVRGREREIVAMFVDLRDSTRLGEAQPALRRGVRPQPSSSPRCSRRCARPAGYYAQFRGDGLLALYGLRSDHAAACREALAGAAEMQTRIERLNATLASELREPLRIGIGVHSGVAIVGTMGPPDAPIYSAIGDTVNIAARFEGLSKYYRCTLVVSCQTVERAGLRPSDAEAEAHAVPVRGRDARLEVYAVADPRKLVRGV